MLTLAEKVLFVLAALASLYYTWRGAARIMSHINSGQGKIDWSLALKRVWELILKVGLFQPVFRFRLWTSVLHGLVGWGFLSFLLINLADLIYAFADFKLLDHLGWFGNFYRLLADIVNVLIIVGIVALWRALEAGDEKRIYELSLPISNLVAVQNSLDAFLAIEKYLLVRQGVFRNTLVRGPVGYAMDDETRREVDRLFELVVRAVGCDG